LIMWKLILALAVTVTSWI